MTKRLVQLTLVIFIMCPWVAAQTRASRGRAGAGKSGGQPVEAQLRALQRKWLDAYAKHDAHAMALIEADDFTITFPDGSVRTKAKEIEAQESAASQPADQPLVFTTEEESIRVYGNAAVITGVLVSKGGRQSPGGANKSRYTDVYVRRGGAWQVVASQLTAIPDSTQKGGGGSVGTEVTTPSGLKYVDIVVGTGAAPKPGDRLTVHYVGTLEDGKKFDSSYDHGQPFTLPIGMGRVIKGWDEGLMTMRVGGKRKLIIPPDLGYGARGAPPVIPPNATLIFEVELLSIQ